MKIQIINPIEYPSWDNLLLTSDQSSFFHTASWAKVLQESYDYNPLYFATIVDNCLTGLVPIMEIRSFLTGRRGVSLPFTDECQPIAEDENHFAELLDRVVDYGRQNRWQNIEVRGGSRHLKNVEHSSIYLKHSFTLEFQIEMIFKNLKGSVKRNIKKAHLSKLQVSISNSWDDLRKFCALNWLTRRIHGLPPQPLFFFRNIYKHVIAKKRGFVSIATYNLKPVAAAVFFLSKQHAFYKYGASDRAFLHLRPNNFVMWEAIRHLSREGVDNLDLGRTDLYNEGLTQYKRAWGANEQQLHYYKFNVMKKSFFSAPSAAKSSYPLFKKMPLSLLRLTGYLLYRHVG